MMDSNKQPDRMRGDYQCPLCKTKWKSDNANASIPNECNKCRINVYATNLVCKSALKEFYESEAVTKCQLKKEVFLHVFLLLAVQRSQTILRPSSNDLLSNNPQLIDLLLRYFFKQKIYTPITPQSNGQTKLDNNQADLIKRKDSKTNLNRSTPSKKCDHKRYNYECQECNSKLNSIHHGNDQYGNKYKVHAKCLVRKL